MLSQDFRRALDLRSTWFTVRVLQLDAASGRGARQHRAATVLRGFVRGLGKVRLEQQVNGGTWKTVRRIRTRPDGRFTVSVDPAADDQLPPRDAASARAPRSPSRLASRSSRGCGARGTP